MLMKIGVDARLLSRPLTGIGRYTLEMCRALCKAQGVSLYLYSPAPVCDEARAGLETAVIRTAAWDNGLLRLLWSESYLPWWAKRDGVDIYWGPAQRLPRFLSGNIASVVTIHDLVWKYAGETMRPLSRILERYQMPLAVRISDEVVCDSLATANAVRREFCVDPDRLSVVPLGANLTESIVPFESLQQFDIERSYFLFVGTLEPRKNLVNLLVAYARLPEPVKAQAMLVIAGGKGWGGVDLQGIINRLGLAAHVRVLGYVDEPILATLYANAQFLVMPSFYEGFGLPLVEAMAHGTPVLTANNSSMPEVAGDAGLLVDAQGVDSIANALNRLITDKALRKKLATNAKANAARFNWDKSAEQLITVFEKAIATRNSRQA